MCMAWLARGGGGGGGGQPGGGGGPPKKKKKKKKKKAGFSHAIYLQVQGGPEEYLYVTKGLTKPNQTFRNIQAGMLV
jgi:hypothetical protein